MESYDVGVNCPWIYWILNSTEIRSDIKAMFNTTDSEWKCPSCKKTLKKKKKERKKYI